MIWENVVILCFKECDCISDICVELEWLGLCVCEMVDSFSVMGSVYFVGGIIVDGYGDYCMIMLLILLGLWVDVLF